MKPKPSQRNSSLLRAVVAAGAILAASASGDARAEPNGLKFGDGRVHPYFELVSRYDSAAVMASRNAGSHEVSGDLILHLRPGLKLDVPSPVFAVGLNGNLDYHLYTGALNRGTSNASHLEAAADLTLGFNRGGQVSVDVGDRVARTDRIEQPGIQVGALSLKNDAFIQASIRPSGGALQVEPSYHLVTEFFSGLNGGITAPGCKDDLGCDPNELGAFDYLQHNLRLNGTWRFLPKTAFVIDLNAASRHYFDARSRNIDTLKASAGLAGLLTSHLSLVLKLGWGWDLTRDTYSSAVAQAELAYLLSESGSVRLGYLRTFEPTGGLAVSYRDDRGYLDMRLLLGGKLTLRGSAAVDLIHYMAAGPLLAETLVSGELGFDYELASWANLGLGYRASYREGDPYTYLSLDHFTRQEPYLRLQAIY